MGPVKVVGLLLQESETNRIPDGSRSRVSSHIRYPTRNTTSLLYCRPAVDMSTHRRTLGTLLRSR